jgi:hypothetical protein
VFHIVYISTATVDFSQPQLLSLLVKAKGNNARTGITGLLIHKDGRFVQVLEGDEPVVRALFEVIRRDGRHQAVTLILAEEMAERQFVDWSMGFHDLKDSDLLGMYGHDKPLGKALDIEGFKTNPHACLHLLGFIRDMQLVRRANEPGRNFGAT